jgi:hypothetical protein
MQFYLVCCGTLRRGPGSSRTVTHLAKLPSQITPSRCQASQLGHCSAGWEWICCRRERARDRTAQAIKVQPTLELDSGTRGQNTSIPRSPAHTIPTDQVHTHTTTNPVPPPPPIPRSPALPSLPVSMISDPFGYIPTYCRQSTFAREAICWSPWQLRARWPWRQLPQWKGLALLCC